MSALPITVPERIRRESGIPTGPLVVVSTWAAGDKIGLWIARASEPHTGRRWPITASRNEAQKWMEEGQ